MRIVHCFFTFEMGGAQVLAVDLLNNMCIHNQTSLIVVNDHCNNALLEKLDKRVAVYKIERKEGSRNPWPLLRFNLLLRKLAPHIIHCHEPNIGKIIRAGVGKLIYTIHDTGIPTVEYHHFHSLVAISDAVYQDVAHRSDRQLSKVYNGIDTSHFEKRGSYKMGKEVIKLVQLSRLMHEKKGQHILLEALQILKAEYNLHHITLDFVGVGPSMSYLTQLVQSLGMTENVVFQGEKDRYWLAKNLGKYHLLVQPSLYEGFGLTILEGFAAGLPVLASDIEGPAEIITRTPRGVLFKKGDSRDCAAVLRGVLLAYENGEIERVMQNSASITETEYSITSCVAGYMSEYEALVDQKKGF